MPGCIYDRVGGVVPRWWVRRPSLHSPAVGNSASAILSPSCPSGLTCSETAGRRSLVFTKRVPQAVGWFQGAWFVIASVFISTVTRQHLLRSTSCISSSQTVRVCALRQELINGSCEDPSRPHLWAGRVGSQGNGCIWSLKERVEVYTQAQASAWMILFPSGSEATACLPSCLPK